MATVAFDSMSRSSLQKMEALLLSDYTEALESINSLGDTNFFRLLTGMLARGSEELLAELDLERERTPGDMELRKLARQHGSATARMFSNAIWTSGNPNCVITKFKSDVDPALIDFARALCAVSGLLLEMHKQTSDGEGRELTPEENVYWYSMLPKTIEWTSLLWEALSASEDPLAPYNRTGDAIQMFAVQAFSLLSRMFEAEDQNLDSHFLSTQLGYRRSAAPQIAFLCWMKATDFNHMDDWFAIMKVFKLEKDNGDLPIRAALVDDGVRRYGTAPIIARLSSILILDDKDKQIQRQAMCSAFLSSVTHNTNLRNAIGSSGFIIHAIRDAWDLLSQFQGYGSSPGFRDVTIMLPATLIYCILEMVRNGPRFLLLVLSEDLLSLVARLFYLFAFHEAESRHIGRGLRSDQLPIISGRLQQISAGVCSYMPKSAVEGIRRKLTPTFLRTLDALRSLDASPYVTLMVLWWNNIGQSVGIDEEAMRQALKDEPAAEPLRGCYWEKCVLFGVRTHLKFLICERCGNAQYCDVEPCQRRDWHEGGHKATCGANKAKQTTKVGCESQLAALPKRLVPVQPSCGHWSKIELCTGFKIAQCGVVCKSFIGIFCGVLVSYCVE